MKRHFHLHALLLVAIALTAGCATSDPAKKTVTPSRAGDREVRKVVVAGVKIGDGREVVRRFPQAKRVPGGSPGNETYEIYKPNPQISMLVLVFRDGRVWKMELRYFNGPTENSLTRAGGWSGLRDILIKRFGPPVKTGPGVPQLNTLRGLTPAYARFNGVWDFPKANRQIHYIVLSDAKGGVGVVTFIDSTPRVVPNIPPPPPVVPNPGF